MPFRHLVTVAQVAGFDPGRVREVLARTGYRVTDEENLTRSLGYVRNWLDEFAPEKVRFAIATDLPEASGRLDTDQRRFLLALADGLPDEAGGEELHTLIYDLIKERNAPSPGHYFEAIYIAFIGKEQGPRAGHFLATLPRDFVLSRLREAGGA